MAWRWAASRGTMVHPMGEWPVSEPVVEPTIDGFVDDDDDEIDVYDDDEEDDEDDEANAASGGPNYRRAYSNAVRRLAKAEHEFATRPERDVRDGKKMRRALPEAWMVELAVSMAFFARSFDISVDLWPYRRLSAKLDPAGLSLPEGVDIVEAVRRVDAALLSVSRKWYDRNIAIPLGRRAAVDLSAAPRGTRDPGADRLDGVGERWIVDNRDYVPRTYAALTADIELAQVLLRAESERFQADAEETSSAGRPAEAVSSLGLAQVCIGASMLVGRLSGDEAGSIFETEEAVRALQESADHSRKPILGPETNPLVKAIAKAVAPKTLKSDAGEQFCRDIAVEAVRALGYAAP